MNLKKGLFLSFLAIALVLIALLMAARALAPKPGPELLSTTEGLSPNLLSGAVTGLDPGDRVQLHLKRLVEAGVDGPGETVHRFGVVNGRWQQPGLILSPGHYRLVPEADDYVHIPQSIVFQVPEESTVWHYTSFNFEFLHPEDAPARLGLPLCVEEIPPHVAVTAVPQGKPSPAPETESVQPGPPITTFGLCYANHLADVRLVPAGLQGRISGLPDGKTATVALYALPPVRDESYGQGEPPPPDSSWMYPPEVASLAETPEIGPDWSLVATLAVGNGPWGLVDPSLVGRKYLVTAYVPGQTVMPPAYEVVIFAGKAPGFPGSVDFAFGLESQDAPSSEALTTPGAPTAPPTPGPMLSLPTESTAAPNVASAPTV